MSAPKFCENCDNWEFVYENYTGKFGTCTDPTVEDMILLDPEEPIDSDEKVMHTHHHFGCIYHTPRHGRVVTKIDLKEIEDDLDDDENDDDDE